MIGEDFRYKPGVIQKAKFEYSLLGETFNKTFKKGHKINKVIKYNNDFVYDSVHNFNKYNVPNFNEISSIDSKFNKINKFDKDLLKLNNIKSRTEKANQKMCSFFKKIHHCFIMS